MDAAEIVRRAVATGAFRYPENKPPALPKKRASGAGRKAKPRTPEEQAARKEADRARRLEYGRLWREKRKELKCQ